MVRQVLEPGALTGSGLCLLSEKPKIRKAEKPKSRKAEKRKAEKTKHRV